ncbi:hypothetical protein TrLO_g8239 [Triparma laevis f. longispina]|uniref:Uncharacterized protein n=1 Tax=Triparma laevis f. longispina TaxID=1714387 RepID=A0A9W7FAN5_9STRA|nr:hypothetical protein TrLO_g8239 [Triparma laevis f. longispina]
MISAKAGARRLASMRFATKKMLSTHRSVNFLRCGGPSVAGLRPLAPSSAPADGFGPGFGRSSVGSRLFSTIGSEEGGGQDDSAEDDDSGDGLEVGDEGDHLEADEDDVVVELPSTSLAFTSALKPKEVVGALDDYIVGQADAKRAVAIALRNRWRRKQLPENFKAEVIPKNILMIGPTGCGKTEIARRLAKLSQAPFIKVEATKFTEVGFHGRDVDQIIRDLLDVSINLTKKRKTELMREEAKLVVEEKLLDKLTGPHGRLDSKKSFRGLLREGKLEDRPIEIEVPEDRDKNGVIQIDQSSPMTVNELLGGVQKFMGGKGQTQKKKMKVKDARPLIEEIELEKLLDMGDIKKEAIAAVEESGIVFIDEIDKICSSGDYRGADASAEGVQRDLLPLIEGSTISTKHGNVNTDYILFVASGAFHSCKPSDLLAELQGRLPIRVELQGLSEDDMYRILTEPITNMIRQQVELLSTEEVELVFEDDAVREIARMAALLNKTVENIGARRLHTVVERIVEELSFEAPEMEEGAVITVTKDLVEERVSDMLVESDLSRFIL